MNRCILERTRRFRVVVRTKEERRVVGKKERRNAAKKEGGDCHSNRLEIIQRAPLGPGSILGARSKMAPHEYIIVAIARVAAG